MDVFIEDRLALASREPVLDALWSSDTTAPLLAVAHEREVCFFDAKLQPVGLAFTAPARIKVAAWTPGSTALVAGLEDGRVVTFYPTTRETREECDAHPTAITRLDFAPQNRLMLSQDRDSALVFWRDGSPVKGLQQTAPLTVVLFADFLHERKDRLRKTVRLLFFGDKLGSIFYCEEKRLEVQELCRINGAIKELFFYAKTNSVVVVTSTFYLVQFRISTEEDIVPDKKVKLSMENSPEHLLGVWMPPATFGLTARDSLLRIWNVETGLSYTLDVGRLAAPTDRVRPKILQAVYDATTARLTLLLSTTQTLILTHRTHAALTDESDWTVVESPDTKGLVDVMRMVAGGPPGVSVLCRAGVAVFRPFRLRLFVEPSKQLRVFLRGPTTLEVFEGNAKEARRIDFLEPFADFLISDQTLAILTPRREVLVSTAFELLSAHNKLAPVVAGGAYSYGLKKHSRLSVPGTGPVRLARHGFLVSDAGRLVFVAYKTAVGTDFCHPESDAIFTDLSFNNSGEHLLAVDTARRLRVFQAAPTAFRLLHDCIDPATILTGQTDDTPPILAAVLDDSGDKVALLLQRPSDNLVLLNLAKRTSGTTTVADPRSVERLTFSKSDARFLAVVERCRDQLSVSTYVADEDTLTLFDTLKPTPGSHFLDADFPEAFFCRTDDTGDPKLTTQACPTFARLLDTTDSPLVRSFTRDFCHSLALQKLTRALADLRRLERGFELEDCWTSLFDKALALRNLKMAELCLSKIKFVRGRLFSEVGGGTSNPLERLGDLSLSFNQPERAKQLYMEAGLYGRIAEVLFLERDLEVLLSFCAKYDKSLLNFYLMKIAEDHLASGAHSDFLALARRAKISREATLRALDPHRDAEFIQRLADSENWPEAQRLAAKQALQMGSAVDAKRYLEACPENRRVAAEFALRHQRDFDAAKTLSLAGSRTDPESLCINALLAQHRETTGDILPAVELMAKSQQTLKVVRMLQRHATHFASHEDFRDKIVDLVYAQVVQTPGHYASGAVAEYLLSLGMHERARTVWMQSGDLARAQWVAATHGLPAPESLGELSKHSLGSIDALPKLPRQQSIMGEVTAARLLEAGDFERAASLLGDKTNGYQATTTDLAAARNLDHPRRSELVRLTAKNLSRHGTYEPAIEAFLELKDNAAVLKTMVRARMVGRAVQFANFSRDESLFLLAADALQGFPIHFKDTVFTAIVSLYTKAKKPAKAVDFLRNFCVEMFESGAVEDCMEALEMADKLLPKLTPEEAYGFAEMLREDRAFLTQFVAAQDALRDGRDTDAWGTLEELTARGKYTLFGGTKRLAEKALQAAVRTGAAARAVELAQLVSRNAATLKTALGPVDYEIFRGMSGGGPSIDAPDADGIEERLDT